MKIITGLFILVVLLGNYTIFKTFFGGLPVYNYETLNRSYLEVPWKGSTFDNIENGFNSYKHENPNTNDTILYRTFKMNPLKFWLWHDYATDKRYRLKYKGSKTK